MAGIPAQRDGLATGAGHGRRGPGSAPSLNAISVRRLDVYPAALIVLLLGSAVARQAITSSLGNPIPATYGFSAVLLLAWGGSRRFRPEGPAELGLSLSAILVGVGVAALLLAPGLLLRTQGHPSQADQFGAGFFLPFVPALLWVAPAEEMFLRGLLQPMLRARFGAGLAIVAGGVLFAAIHLPAYGWSAMPLDFGVGLLLGWLRQETGSVVACVTAHTLADLGSWFLA